ncbi:phage major capsid protein [Photobacterium alginatilyticum]|uniref:Phage major capsid protein n=1 Tax=Photobacterium alginatilyticum TaxID=1775171 RepID=A0ABW9YIQ9_9GAMM|nr:phage major capsid protein [Photobacterium alginatilyticum]NBI53447.1 phage major capsid protein [Photobacterium alginatilyticum]
MTINLENRTAEIAFSSENPVERWGGFEVLDHSEGAVDLVRFETGEAALLADHNWRDQIGVILEARIDQATKKGRALVKFSQSQRGEEFFQDVIDGIRRSISVGYEILEAKLEQHQRDGLDVYRITRWRPIEASIVSVPADLESGVGRSDETGPLTCRDGKTEYYAGRTIENDFKGSESHTEGEKMTDKTKPDAITRAKEEADKKRAADLMEMGENFKCPDLAARVFAEGGDCDDLRVKILESRSTSKPEAARSGDLDIGLTDAEADSFRITNLLRAQVDPQYKKQAGFEMEAARAVTEKMVARGMPVSDGFNIPLEVLKREIKVDGNAAPLVADNLVASSFIELLQNKLGVMQAGATVLSGLVGNVVIPRALTGPKAFWIKKEGDNTTNTTATFDDLTMTPKHLGAYVDISAQALIQAEIPLEMWLRSELANAIALEIDRAAIYGNPLESDKTTATGEPKGLVKYAKLPTVDFTAENPTYAELVAMETKLETANAEGPFKFLVNPATKGHARTTQKFTGDTITGGTIWEPGGKLIERPAIVTNQITKGDIFAGNWADLVVGIWGGLNLLADPYTGGKSGSLRLVARQFVDTAVRREVQFVHGRKKPAA